MDFLRWAVSWGNERCVAGYEWVQCEVSGRRQWLLASADPQNVEPVPGSQTDTVAFMRLADLDDCRDAIAAFAATYGNLRTSGLPGQQDIGQEGSRRYRGATFDRWRYHILSLKYWTTIWELSRKGDDAGGTLAAYWKSRSVVPGVKGAGKDEVFSFPKISKEELETTYDPGLPADLLIQVAKSHLNGILRNRIGDMWPRIWNANTPVFKLEGDGLAGSAWLQFARAVANDIVIMRCKYCSAPFEQTPVVLKSNREFCEGNRCRLAYFRARKKQARTMRADGAHLRTIAKELGTDVATVRGWVGE